MEKVKIKNIYCDEEINELIKENFSRGKWGYQKFSSIMSKLLKEYLLNKPTLESLKEKEELIKKDINRLNKELQDIQIQKEFLITERENNFILTEREASYLYETYKILSIDNTKLITRLKLFNNLFNKNIQENEFNDLIKKAMDEFPNPKEFIIEI